MATNKKRTSWWQTIKRWFGMKAEVANDQMDNMVDIETQLKRKIRELREQREEIRNGDRLAQALGMRDQLDSQLATLNRKYAQKNYASTIRTLKEANKLEQAKQVLLEMKKAESEIARVKELLVTATQTREKIEKDLNMLDVNIAQATADLEDLRQRNQMAQQTEEIYDLMNDISNINVGYDTDGIQQQITERERAAAGKRIMHDNANVVNNAQHDAMMSSLDDELARF